MRKISESFLKLLIDEREIFFSLILSLNNNKINYVRTAIRKVTICETASYRYM